MDKKKMVTTNFISNVTKKLERFLIKKAGFKLTGLNYELILFSINDKYSPDSQYSLILSAALLNGTQPKEIIKELFLHLKEQLNMEEYNLISRVNILHPEDPFVKSMKTVFAFRFTEYEISDLTVGGVHIDFAYLVKSPVLDKLIAGKVLKMELKLSESYFPEFVNAGIIEIDDNFNVKYLTGTALAKYSQYNNTDFLGFLNERSVSQFGLSDSQYVKKINIDQIIRIE